MDLGSINWTTLFYSNFNINENLNTFYYHIDYAIKNYIFKNRTHKLCISIWFSNKLKTLIKEKKVHSTFKILKTTVSFTYCSDIRKKCNYLRYRDCKVFINKTQQLVKLNQKSFWNFYRLQESINQYPLLCHVMRRKLLLVLTLLTNLENTFQIYVKQVL